MSSFNRLKRDFIQNVEFDNGDVVVKKGDGIKVRHSIKDFDNINSKIKKQHQNVKELVDKNNKTAKYLKTGKVVSVVSIVPTILAGGVISVITINPFPLVASAGISSTLGGGAYLLNKKFKTIKNDNENLKIAFDKSTIASDSSKRVNEEILEYTNVINFPSNSNDFYSRINSGSKSYVKSKVA